MFWRESKRRRWPSTTVSRTRFTIPRSIGSLPPSWRTKTKSESPWWTCSSWSPTTALSSSDAATDALRSVSLARRPGPSAHLFMQDLSPNMVFVCIEKMRECNRTMGFSCQLEYSISNATSLPFADDMFDAVFHFGGFNQFDDLRKGAAEFTRV